jgi:ribosomal silencing factor RsfS
LGKGKLEAYNNTEVLALDESEVDAWDDCLVHAKGNSTIHAKDFAKVYAMENSNIDGGYQSYVIQKSSTANIINSVHFVNVSKE